MIKVNKAHFEKKDSDEKVVTGFRGNNIPNLGLVHSLHGDCMNCYQPRIESVNIKNIQPSDVDFPKLSGGEKTITMNTKVSVILPLHVYHKLRAYTNLVDKEITGLGLVQTITPTKFKITDIYLLKQTVSAAECEIEPEATAQLMERLINEGKNPSELRFWWHSHANMATFWSGTDSRTSEQFKGTEYLISLVINHAGEMRCKLSYYNPIEITIDNIEIIVESLSIGQEVIDECKKEIEELVHMRTWLSNNDKDKKDDRKLTKKEKKEKKKKEKQGSLIADQDYYYEEGEQYDSITYNHDEKTKKMLEDLGDEFQEGGISFIFNVLTDKYMAFDITTNMRITKSEVMQTLGYFSTTNPEYYFGIILQDDCE